MKKVFVIGIGAGNPDYVTVQAINALNEVDVFFVMDKGKEKEELVRLRKEICNRYIENRSYRTIEAADPPRDRNSTSYEEAVGSWHDQRTALYEQLSSAMRSVARFWCGATRHFTTAHLGLSSESLREERSPLSTRSFRGSAASRH